MNAFAKITMVGVALAAGALAAAAQNSPAKQSDPAKERDRLVCRSMPVSGTLAGRRRQCFTRAQWDRIAQGAQKQTVELQGTLPSGQIAN
jgi:hypothetical protein